MNIEITDLDMILNYLETTSLEPHDNYSSEFTYKDQKILYKYIKQLQQENKILKENAENNDKVVDKANWENMLLKKENKQLKSIIYELREHMLDIDYKMGWEYVEYLDRLLPEKIVKEISDKKKRNTGIM